VDGVVAVYQIDVFRSPAAGENVPWRGLVAIATVMVVCFEDGAQRHLFPQLACLDVVSVDGARPQFSLPSAPADVKEALVQLGAPRPHQVFDHEYIFPFVPQMADVLFGLRPKQFACVG
jgi:hypothetical protein